MQRDKIETEFVRSLSSNKIRLTYSEIAEISSSVIDDQTYKNSSTKLTRAMCERQYRDTIERRQNRNRVVRNLSTTD